MIRSFRHRGLKRFFVQGDPSRIRSDLRDRVEVVLGLLNSATSLEDLNTAGHRLHPLKGDMKGLWSMTVSGNWRIVFRFQEGEASDVDLVDYH